MGKPSGYSVASYGDMVSCEPRMSAYADALRQAVTPGCTVIDIGAGPGVFAILACQYGAGNVIAIEPDDAVELLVAFAAENHCSEQITVFQGLSTDYTPLLKADVIISDIRGCLPLFETHIPTIVDARERLLSPNGRLIPSRDTLRIALVQSPKTYAPCVEPWLHNKFGLDLSKGHRFSVNEWCKVSLGPDDLLSDPQDLEVLDYARISDANLAAKAALVPTRPGKAHGFAVWFDAELSPGLGFSNAPGEPKLVYGQTFFPLECVVDLEVGDRIDVEIKANLVEGSYVWSWNSKVWRGGASEPEAVYRQSSFLAKVMQPQKLARHANRYVPLAQRAHAIDRFCLSLFDGRKSLGEIAEDLAAEFPGTFRNAVQALNHVATLAERYHGIC